MAYKYLFHLIADHAGLLRRISIGSIADGLIFKGLRNYLPIITSYSTLSPQRKPLKIRPLQTLVVFLLRYPPSKTAMIYN